MKVTRGLIDKLIALRDGESLPSSGLKGKWVDELISDRILVNSSRGSKSSLKAVDSESFVRPWRELTSVLLTSIRREIC